ncbi:hypothetical protein ACKVMT_07400 [Halobacteriales archaeon Cl-PHB]
MRLSRPPLPTDGDDWRVVGRTTRTVLGKPAYALLALLCAGAGLTLLVFTQNTALLFDVILNGSLTTDARLTILAQQYPFLGPVYGPLTGGLLVVTAALFGLNLAILVFHLVRDRAAMTGSSGSLLGITFGTLGAGCAACGSVLLSGVLSLFGVTGVLALLPLEGLEFALLALVTLVLSVYWLSESLQQAGVEGCRVTFDQQGV